MIIGKIAKIVDKYRVIINKGKEDGVVKNMKFYVYEEGEDIVDPDTKGNIEKEEILKANLKVIHVQDKISILESDETETVTKVVPGLGGFADMIRPREVTREVMKSLPIEQEKFEKKEKVIKIGDLVKQI